MDRLTRFPIGWPSRFGVGFALGLAITLVDNFASGGEVSPIVVVALILAATVAAGASWGWRGWVAAAGTWVCVPLAHLVKRVLGLPDTLHPNTYASIMMLAAFSLVIAAVGLGCGALGRQLVMSGKADTPETAEP